MGTGEGEERASVVPVLHSSFILHPSSHRCPAGERNDPADQVDCGAGADRHGQRGQVRVPSSSGSEPRPTQSRKRPRTMRPARIPIYGLTPALMGDPFPSNKQRNFPLGTLIPVWQHVPRYGIEHERPPAFFEKGERPHRSVMFWALHGCDYRESFGQCANHRTFL